LLILGVGLLLHHVHDRLRERIPLHFFCNTHQGQLRPLPNECQGQRCDRRRRRQVLSGEPGCGLEREPKATFLRWLLQLLPSIAFCLSYSKICSTDSWVSLIVGTETEKKEQRGKKKTRV
jgi:hypothetical protein